MDLIRSIERFSRGRYAGPIGWMDHKGDGEWAVALRCAELEGVKARVFAGAGIVIGSDPQSELEETDLKLRAMLSALQPSD
jgi:menaquinone-specific isochorismate synthase